MKRKIWWQNKLQQHKKFKDWQGNPDPEFHTSSDSDDDWGFWRSIRPEAAVVAAPEFAEEADPEAAGVAAPEFAEEAAPEAAVGAAPVFAEEAAPDPPPMDAAPSGAALDPEAAPHPEAAVDPEAATGAAPEAAASGRRVRLSRKTKL